MICNQIIRGRWKTLEDDEPSLKMQDYGSLKTATRKSKDQDDVFWMIPGGKLPADRN